MINTILLVEDDTELQKYLKNLLSEENYSLKVLGDGLSVMNEIDNLKPDLVLLDIMLPSISGTSVCKDIKKEYPEIPVIVLTGKSGLSDKINAFELGADDYITKPFAPEELLARIRARLKTNNSNKTIKVADLELDPESMQVKRGTKEINLTRQEYKLLEYMMNNAGKVLTRESLLNKIWPTSFDIETRVIDVYISYLRRKMDSGHKKKLIHSVRGFGYTMKI